MSEWEEEFLTSVDQRVRQYGRAFADPELGGPGQTLSPLQGRKLKEITKKAKGEGPKWKKPSPEIEPEPEPDAG